MALNAPAGTALAPAQQVGVRGPSLWRRIWRERWIYLFILPGALYFVVFRYLPLLGNVIAFQDYSPFLGFEDSPFVGLANTERLFTDPDFQTALSNTLVISFLQLIFFFPALIVLDMLFPVVYIVAISFSSYADVARGGLILFTAIRRLKRIGPRSRAASSPGPCSLTNAVGFNPGSLPPPTQTVQMAVVVIATVPILVTYSLLQKYFTQGVLTGAIKG